MKQYIWFHPLYIKDTSPDILKGQILNASKKDYTVLEENDLHKVRAWDHLTIVGHSTAPKNTLDEDDDEDIDTGLFIQGETALQCIDRLQKSGLRVPPKILSLECCKAGVTNGIAQMLSTQSFFATSLVESSNGSVGRNPGKTKWSLEEDSFGRVLMHPTSFQWIFFYEGLVVAEHQHGEYKLHDILQTILPSNFHDSFFSCYKPGLFGGRAGRHCWFGNKIDLEQATLFAEDDPDSATAKALEMVMSYKSAPGM
jgi:hypothetical protein